MNKQKSLNQSLIKKGELIEGLDIDKYLEAILEKYEKFIEQRQNEFDYFCEKTQETLLKKLILAEFSRAAEEKEQLRIFKKIKEKITKKQKEIDKEKEEKRKKLIYAIKRIM